MAALELIDTTLFNDANLVSYYRFEGNSNDAKDSNNGSDASMSYGSPAQFGQAGQFDGTNSIITVTDATNLHFGTGGYTFLGWVRPASLAHGAQDFVGKSTGGGAPYFVHRVNTDGSCLIQFFQDGSNNVNFTTASIFADNTWAFIAITIDRGAGTCYLYLNGSQIGSQVYTGNPTATTSSALVFSDAEFSGIKFQGALDDFAFFNRTLSATEISNHWNGLDAISQNVSANDSTATSESTTLDVIFPGLNFSVNDSVSTSENLGEGGTLYVNIARSGVRIVT